jgi:hypothetical protein
MAHLIKCVECGKEMSSDCYDCPHCKTRNFKGVECGICGKIERESDLKGEYSPFALPHISKFALSHEACREKLKLWLRQYQGLCPVCKSPKIPDGCNYPLTCTNCGHTPVSDDCYYCGYPTIYRSKGTIGVSPSNGVYHYLGGDAHRYGDGGAHKLCYYNRHTFPPSPCFIATAALGSPLAPEVKTLQTFRDNVLRKYYVGRKFITLYESVSPPFARIIARNNVLRYLTRFLIVYPATWFAKWVMKS